MKELYWITVIGKISTTMCILAVITFSCMCSFLVLYFIIRDDHNPAKELLSAFKCFFIATVLTGLIAIFMPSKEELLFIYGVGSTIDYVQSNEEAKQLPDKAVKALNLWADDYLKDNKTNETAD